MPYYQTIDLVSGQRGRSHSSDRPPENAAALAEVLRDLRESEDMIPVALPHDEEHSLSARFWGKCLIATVWLGTQPQGLIAVAWHSRCGATVWRVLHECTEEPLVVKAAHCPPEPWIAVLSTGSIPQYLPVDLGWAWVRVRKEQSGVSAEEVNRAART